MNITKLTVGKRLEETMNVANALQDKAGHLSQAVGVFRLDRLSAARPDRYQRAPLLIASHVR